MTSKHYHKASSCFRDRVSKKQHGFRCKLGGYNNILKYYNPMRMVHSLVSKMLQVRTELTTPASLAHALPYKQGMLTNCTTEAAK